MLAALSGCAVADRAGNVVTSTVAPPSADLPIVPVNAPDANLANNPVVAATRGSVVKIRGVASSCKRLLDGAGFVVAPNRVMSAAHVVAGSDSVSVEVDGKTHDAQVVSFDSDADISILDVPNLTAPPLAFTSSSAARGSDALILGYPGGGSFTATPARIRETVSLNGPDIYRTKTVHRQVHVIRGPVKQGDSGGPLINLDGQVLGVDFGAADDDPDTGFTLTAAEVAPQMAKIGNTQPVDTGACTG